jgi:hypothetical protein
VRSRILIGAGALVLAGLPVSASAEICEGLLSWLCFSSEAASDPLRPTRSTSDGPASGNSRAPGIAGDCLSREQVHDGYPRYRVINGRRCWYGSVNGRPPKRAHSERAAHRGRGRNEPQIARSEPSDCELQALKLDEPDKKSFMKQCMSGSVR